MEKKHLSKILARASADSVRTLADEIKTKYMPVIVKAPEKSLAMIRLRERSVKACSIWVR